MHLAAMGTQAGNWMKHPQDCQVGGTTTEEGDLASLRWFKVSSHLVTGVGLMGP